MKALSISIVGAIFLYLAFFFIPQTVGNLVVNSDKEFIARQQQINKMPHSTEYQIGVRNMQQAKLNSEKNSKLISLRFILTIVSFLLLIGLGVYLFSLYERIEKRIKTKQQNKKLRSALQKIRQRESTSDGIIELFDLAPALGIERRNLFNAIFSEITRLRMSRKEILDSTEYKKTMLHIENAKRSLQLEDSIAPYTYMRLSTEAFSKTVLQCSAETINEEDDQYTRLKKIEDNNLLSGDDLKILHRIRKAGNDALHNGVADDKHAPILLEQYQTIVQTWIEGIAE